MSDHFQQIYATQAEKYDTMVRREDYQGNLLPALTAICPFDDAGVVEFGAGTGRLTRLIAPVAKHITITDIAPAMLTVARESLCEIGTNWSLAAADNRAMPVRTNSADIAIAGWSFGHFVAWYGDRWRDEIGRAVDEMQRVLKPGGTAIILETMGTGSKSPAPPTDGLSAYYTWLENERGFAYSWIRTDYKFASINEADELTRFFFGDAMADRVREESLKILPECTGIWSHKR